MIIILFALVLFSVLIEVSTPATAGGSDSTEVSPPATAGGSDRTEVSPPATAGGSDSIFARTNSVLLQEQRPPTDAASAQIYQDKCATCHDKPVGRVPPRSAIAMRSTEDIIQTMTTGSMKQFADGLTADQIRTLSIYLTAEQAGAPARGKLHANPCKS